MGSSPFKISTLTCPGPLCRYYVVLVRLRLRTPVSDVSCLPPFTPGSEAGHPHQARHPRRGDPHVQGCGAPHIQEHNNEGGYVFSVVYRQLLSLSSSSQGIMLSDHQGHNSPGRRLYASFCNMYACHPGVCAYRLCVCVFIIQSIRNPLQPQHPTSPASSFSPHPLTPAHTAGLLGPLQRQRLPKSSGCCARRHAIHVVQHREAGGAGVPQVRI